MTGAAKFYVALSGFLAVLVKSLSDGHVTTTEIGDLIIALATAITVFVVPNRQSNSPIKGVDNSGRSTL